MATKKPLAPRAEYATKQVTPLILDFCDWLEAETGYKVDPLSVYLGSALRGEFQKSPANQARLAAQAERIAAEKLAREQRASKSEKPKQAKVKAAPTRRRPASPSKVEVKA